MDIRKNDFVVIGSGPAGEGASIKCAKSGRKVALVKKFPKVGGNCTHLGTIPCKSLRQALQQIMEFKSNPLFEDCILPIKFPDLLKLQVVLFLDK